jgi:hypothetical protein
MSDANFEAFVKRELGDVAVMDEGRYISPKIQKYWLTWQAARAAERDEAASISAEQLERLARHGCGGDDTRWSFSDAGLRRTIEAALEQYRKEPT